MDDDKTEKIMTSKKVNFINRRLIVNTQLQITILMHSLATAFVLFLLNLAFEKLFFKFLDSPNRFVLLGAFLVGMFVLVLLIVIHSFFLTNKIAGPIFRLKKHMEDAADAKVVQEIEFRKLDFFSEILVPYNKILDKLRAYQKKSL